MKAHFKHMMLLLAFFASATTLRAQQMPPIPVDKNVRMGQLENGLTYYIRANKRPENRANFYIVQRVGSILEEESQRGLAHFLEHMAFNGSKNFPAGDDGKNMISYLETIGVKFGANLNAYTSMDETVYNINDVPTTTAGAVDSCLLILHDWSNALLLREKEIDKERKVIHEEWRTRRDASQRMIDSIAPAIFKDSKYAHRMPIGLMSVVDHFEPQVLRDYYHKWYRPDLQGIIVVGDIDAEEVEQKVKTLFGSIPKPENPAERVYEQIPDNDEPIVAIATDKELSNSNVMIAFKRNIIPADRKTTMDYLVFRFATQMISRMLSDRLQEMLQQENPPFAFAMVMNSSFFGVHTKDALQLVGVSRPKEAEVTIATLLRETKRAHDFGFTEGEYERAKANYLSGMEKLYNEREKQQNGYYVQQYVQHFLKNEPIPSIEDEYNTMSQMIVPNIPVAAINQIMQQIITDKNRVVVLMGNESEKATFPSIDRIREIIQEVDREKLEAYTDNTVQEPLLAQLPPKGSITNETTDTERGVTVWTLSNGAKVAVRETDFKQDEILMSGFAFGGTSVIGNEHMAEIKLINDIVPEGGLGNFSATDLKKALSGKHAGVSTNVDQYNQNVNGTSNVKDLETMMQLLYLRFTAIRKDETAYKSIVGRLKGILPMLTSNPDFVFGDSLTSTIYMNDPRVSIPTVEEIESCNYDNLLELYRARFANAADYTFTFVGNVSPAQLKPLVEQYVASLPGTTATAMYDKNRTPERKGIYNNHFMRKLETPKATTAIVYSGDMAYSPENIIRLSALSQLFQMEFTDKIREEKGGTYGVRVQSDAQKIPTEGFSLQFRFDTDPSRRTELVDAINDVTKRLQTEGPDAQMLQKVKEYMLKQHADNLKENGYALRNLQEYLIHGIDRAKDYVKYVNDLSIASLQQFTDELLKQNNRIEVSMSSQE
ncbi:MAG: M16 family metallopeptidase [Tannerella sp.]